MKSTINTPSALNLHLSNGDANASRVTLVKSNRALVDSLLANNGGNRPINRNRVRSLADDMRNGRWKFNGDTIVIDAKGRLIDGQHRLTALREAGYPSIDLLVVNLSTVGEESNAVFRTIDCGKPRTMSDTFAIEGTKYAKNVAAICRILVMTVKGTNSIPTKAEMHTVYERMRSEIDEFAPFGQRKSGMVKFQASTVAAFAIIAYLSGNSDSVRDFAETILGGVGLSQATPEYRLLCYLNARRGKHVTSQDQIDTFCATCRAAIRHLFAEESAKPFTTVKGDNNKTITNLIRWANGVNKPIFAAIFSAAA